MELDELKKVSNEPELNLPQLGELVVRQETTFNAPVTIINCDNPERPKNRKIVINDGGRGRKFVRSLMVALFAVTVLLASLAVVLTVAMNEQGVGEKANDTHRFYSKEDWGGEVAKSFASMETPVPYVIVSHSATATCSSLTDCSHLIQSMQNYHFSIDFSDIAYNFLVDSSGNIYEGRGWTRKNVIVGLTSGKNVNVCLIGDFSQSARPSEEQVNGLRFFLDFAVNAGHLSREYSLLAANATYATLSPGVHVYEVIKKWPNFVSSEK